MKPVLSLVEGFVVANRCHSWLRREMTNIAVIGMGGVGIPCAALLADVPGFHVTGLQRRSERSGWKIERLSGETPHLRACSGERG